MAALRFSFVLFLSSGSWLAVVGLGAIEHPELNINTPLSDEENCNDLVASCQHLPLENSSLLSWALAPALQTARPCWPEWPWICSLPLHLRALL